MHHELLKEIVALCKRRQEQGDHPTEPIADAEVMENAIVQLAARIAKAEDWALRAMLMRSSQNKELLRILRGEA